VGRRFDHVIEGLFAGTLEGDYDSDAAWDAVAQLRSRGGKEVFDYAAAWFASENPLKRARAVDVLCQLQKDPSFREEAFGLITGLLRTERHPLAIQSCLFGLGHLANPEAIPEVLSYQTRSDVEIRYAATFALGCFPNDSRAVEALIQLAADPDPNVRYVSTGMRHLKA
jgi:HEAT repeat protein